MVVRSNSRYTKSIGGVSTRAVASVGGVKRGGLVVETDTFNVLDWGAKGDGVTDDSLAIRLCFSEACKYARDNSAPVEIYFPTGVYAVCPGIWSKDGYTIPITASNVTVRGDGDTSIISLYAPGLQDPETEWRVYLGGGGERAIIRGSLFKVRAGVDNTKFQDLRLTGNCMATTDASNGGKKYPCECTDNVITNTNGTLTDGTLVRFGNTVPAGIVNNQKYWVVNADTENNTFQIAETVNGSPVEFSDSVATFWATDGRGWDWTHKCIPFEGNVEVDGVTFDRWRSECVHRGGTLDITATIRNCLFEYVNASVVSHSSVVLEDSIIRYCYNALECQPAHPNNNFQIRRCVFTASSGNQYSESNGLVLLKENTTTNEAIIEECGFHGWGVAILLADTAYLTTIDNNLFSGCSQPIRLLSQGIVAAEKRSYEGLTISGNLFHRTVTSGSGPIVYYQVGSTIPAHDLTIDGNTTTSDGSEWGDLTSGGGFGDDMLDGYTISNNDLRGGGYTIGSAVMKRPIWTDNTVPATIVFTTGVNQHQFSSTPREVDVFRTNLCRINSLYAEGDVVATLGPALTKFHVGYEVEIRSSTAATVLLGANSDWNTWESDLSINSTTAPVFLVVNEDGKFEVAT